MKILCVVGSRGNSNYGKEVTEKLIAGLYGYNVCIVSGLALGIDSIAHNAALKNDLYTICFPGSGLHPSVIHPRMHRELSEEILDSGGALLSEFHHLQYGDKWTFPKRNRLMMGVSHAVLVIEARQKSGTLITSKYASDYDRDVGAVPGEIFSPLSAGPHMLIRNGATPVTSPDDLLELLGFARRDDVEDVMKQNSLPFYENPLWKSLGETEKRIIQLLQKGPCNKDVVVRELHLDPRDANRILTTLELAGFIKEDGGVVKMV